MIIFIWAEFVTGCNISQSAVNIAFMATIIWVIVIYWITDKQQKYRIIQSLGANLGEGREFIPLLLGEFRVKSANEVNIPFLPSEKVNKIKWKPTCPSWSMEESESGGSSESFAFGIPYSIFFFFFRFSPALDKHV